LLNKLRGKERRKQQEEYKTIRCLILELVLILARCKRLKLSTEEKVTKMMKCMKVVMTQSLLLQCHLK
jgi:hypothetical protein